jgi:hypothetical protein
MNRGMLRPFSDSQQDSLDSIGLKGKRIKLLQPSTEMMEEMIP